MKHLATRLNRVARSMGGTVGLALQDLTGGSVWFRHADMPFPAASLVKLPILIALYDQVAGSRISLEEEIVFDPRDAGIADESGGDGVLANMHPQRAWRVDDLAVLMMTISDNIAANVLIDRLDPLVINQHLQRLGLEVTRVDCKLQRWATLRDGVHNLTTPREMHRLLKLLWEQRLPFSERIIALLKANQFSSRIPFYLDPDVQVAHKTGTLRGVVHDVGIVYAPRAFIFCGLTQEQRDNNRAGLALARMARLVYEELVQDGE